ncbi:DUF2069 domain-containing protein [Lysobacter yananisis]|uniref:DUF2069 domain-containing protein n=1 Tax=Lysobacter yananisis TaxID=1003114 RepID=UPI003CE51193
MSASGPGAHGPGRDAAGPDEAGPDNAGPGERAPAARVADGGAHERSVIDDGTAQGHAGHGATTARPGSQWVLLVCLLALAALFALWYLLPGRHWIAGLTVFVLPPALLAAGVALRSRLAGYWAGVLALFWFCHGVMLAWSSPGERLYAWIEVVLALAVIFSANLAGLKARLGRKRG